MIPICKKASVSIENSLNPLPARYSASCFVNIACPASENSSILKAIRSLTRYCKNSSAAFIIVSSEILFSIAVGEVISAVDESVDATRCQGKGGCQGGDKCLTHALWRDLSERLTGFLNNITLGELVNNQEILDVSGRQHQHETQRNARTQDAINVKLRA